MGIRQIAFAIFVTFSTGLLTFGQEVEIEIRETSKQCDDYLTWAPASARIRLKTPQTTPQDVVLTNDPGNAAGVPTGGDVWFSEGTLSAGAAPPTVDKTELSLSLPANGDWVKFLVAGWFGRTSSEDKDTIIIAHAGSATGAEIGRIALMVRIRKNALDLTDGERDRLLDAIKKLRDNGDYKTYQNIHSVGVGEAHSYRAAGVLVSGRAFVAWHRCFILDFERELQEIDPSVSLPYWDCSRPAVHPATGKRLFSSRFLGSNSVAATGNPFSLPPVDVQFHSSNKLAGWTTDLEPPGVPAVPGAGALLRRRQFDRGQTPVESTFVSLPSDVDVVLPGTFSLFSGMEGTPHGSAHVWGGGSLGSVPIAVQDPLFFLLHCNVDRLWAQWQRLGNPADPRYGNGAAAYEPQNPRTFPATSPSFHKGQYLEDSMWPWNGEIGSGTVRLDDRPVDAPGGQFPQVKGLSPGLKPRPLDTFDYQGRLNTAANMGFGYTDDPFKP